MLVKQVVSSVLPVANTIALWQSARDCQHRVQESDVIWCVKLSG